MDARIKTNVEIHGRAVPSGPPGFSPIVEFFPIEGGTKITVTDAEGKKEIIIPDPEDGFSPTITAQTVEEGTQITITNKNGDTVFIIPNAKDGFSPIVTLTEKENGTEIKVLDAEGEKRGFIKNGKDAEGGGLPPIPAKVGDFLKVTKVENGNATEFEGATPTGGGENWVELADFTNEQETNSITLKWADTPKRKIRMMIYTPAWNVDTNYANVTLITRESLATAFNSAKFYIPPIPKKQSMQSTVEVEIIKNSKGNLVSVTEGSFLWDGKLPTARIQDGITQHAVWRAVDNYGATVFDKIRAVEITTYQKFPIDTKIYVEGCD